jgi:hypothetical protein
MSTLIEGMSWIVRRPRPENDLVVADVVACSCDGIDEQLIRVVGLECCDYLTSGEALAGVLAAAVREAGGVSSDRE